MCVSFCTANFLLRQCIYATFVLWQSWLPARKHVVEALDTRLQIDPSGSIIKLNHYCPWKSHLYELEKETNVKTPILYCLYEVGIWEV